MEHIPFNSRYTYHKSPFGAVQCGTEITFRIVLPRSCECTSAFLLIREDGREFRTVEMFWQSMQGENEEWWQCAFTPEKAGLYFYKFIFTSFGETKEITKASSSFATVSGGGELFQQTVYEENFETPENAFGGVIYQIFPDRFCFSGEKKKNVPPGRILRSDWGNEPVWEPDENGDIDRYDFFQGDFKGIVSKLDYLKSLGVTLIYLNPVFEAYSNHRYDTADYEKTDPLLGTEEDFAFLCKEAKKRDIGVILDGVFSHTGAHSRYFNKYGEYPEKGAYNSKSSPYYEWFKFSRWPDKYDSWWGIDILPEVDEENESYIEYISKILVKWLSLGAGGWRLDVADELPDKFLDALRKTVKDYDKSALIIGEVWEDASNKTAYSKRRRYLLGRQLDSVMNYPFADAVITYAVTGRAEGFIDKIMTVCENYPKKTVDCLMNHIGTHDTVRILTRIATKDKYESSHKNRFKGYLNEEEKNAAFPILKLAATVQFTLPGIPSIYYGDEAGLDGGVDPYNRKCYPYGHENKELTEYYRLLGKIRRENPVFKDGVFEGFSDRDGCVAYLRKNSLQTVAVAANRNPFTVEYILPQGDYACLTGQKVNKNKVTLEPDTAAILLLRK
ncbi:MAG: glycoside hydrolase family 13 protein [Clostridiales bacterium]|nr:glycoside hydrolase family 13 protein [Clostridiales bacterium]